MSATVKEHGLLFNAEMVRRLLDGSKTQTRRPRKIGGYKRGDIIWARETFALHPDADEGYIYRATDPGWDDNDSGIKWTPSILMPRVASRITLEITDVRVQRVQEISEADAKDEGVELTYDNDHYEGIEIYKDEFRRLWNDLYRDLDWSLNPWVWALTFKRVKP